LRSQPWIGRWFDSTQARERLLRMACFVLSERHLDQRPFALRVVQIQRFREILDCLVPLPLIKLRLPQVEIAVWIGWLHADDGLEMSIGDVPLILLSGDHA